jgi:hypothetical protein
VVEILYSTFTSLTVPFIAPVATVVVAVAFVASSDAVAIFAGILVVAAV